MAPVAPPLPSKKMAELLKDQFFQPGFIKELGQAIHQNFHSFDTRAFGEDVFNDPWDQLELKGRMSHIATMLQKHLPHDFPKALGILKKVVSRFNGFDAMVFPDFVRQFGLDHWELSMDALEIFTQYSSAEFAIRSFIIRDQDRTMEKMLSWSRHENHHVRRLSSEGCRPRLPWAMALPEFKNDPSDILPILENLKADESEYVRKSVANNINDISKDNPDTVLALCRRWSNGLKETQWIIRHGLRSLIKKGSQPALDILGYRSSNIELKKFSLEPENIQLGESIKLQFELTNMAKSTASVVVDYVIHFRKANGSNTPKVFKLTNLEMGPGTTHQFSKVHKIVPITTRTYYGGEQVVEVQVNGEILGSRRFNLALEDESPEPVA